MDTWIVSIFWFFWTELLRTGMYMYLFGYLFSNLFGTDRSRISGSYDNYITLERPTMFFFYIDWAITFPVQYMRILISPNPQWYLFFFGFVSLKNYTHPTGCEVVNLVVVLICISLMTNNVENISWASWLLLSFLQRNVCLVH